MLTRAFPNDLEGNHVTGPLTEALVTALTSLVEFGKHRALGRLSEAAAHATVRAIASGIVTMPTTATHLPFKSCLQLR